MHNDPHKGTTETTDDDGDMEINVWGEEVFQRTLADVITSSRESERALFLSGTYADTTSYLIVCLTSDEAEDVRAAEDIIEHLLCSPNPILDAMRRGKLAKLSTPDVARGAALN